MALFIVLFLNRPSKKILKAKSFFITQVFSRDCNLRRHSKPQMEKKTGKTKKGTQMKQKNRQSEKSITPNTSRIAHITESQTKSFQTYNQIEPSKGVSNPWTQCE